MKRSNSNLLRAKSLKNDEFYTQIDVKRRNEKKVEENKIICGDNLKILRDKNKIADNSIDLIYLDPPFNSGKNYKSKEQIEFDDTWSKNEKENKTIFKNLIDSFMFSEEAKKVFNLIESIEENLDDSSTTSYLYFIAPRLLEMKRVLKETGSVYLQCNPTASHYLKLIMDIIFGRKNFQNEIIWHFTGGLNCKFSFPTKHGIIFYYTKTSNNKHCFNIIREEYKKSSGYAKSGITSKSGKHYSPNPKGKPIDDVWDIPIINPMAKERTGYPTQKPEDLLDKIIRISSNENDLVLDPFCGSGTTIAKAKELNRNFIGIDINQNAIKIIEKRLKENKKPLSLFSLKNKFNKKETK